jgi:exopolyphosphatase/guanosine-5'-triphosphate,3'-diphosphate pyrophosphatase
VLLAFLIASQRKQVDTTLLQKLPGSWREKALKLSILIRLAVLLNRSRGNADVVTVQATADSMALSLHFPQEWLASNPLTVADLDREREILSEIQFRISYA